MINFATRSYEPEILDDLSFSGSALKRNLRDLEWVNRYLGGHALVRKGIKMWIAHRQPREEIYLVDAGCGGGDTLRMLQNWPFLKKYRLRLEGIDANDRILEMARHRKKEITEISYRQANIFDDNFQIPRANLITCNLFLHHFEERQIAAFLRKCQKQGVAVLINDLHRSRLAYFLFALLSRLLFFSRVSRSDGCLSIKKGFTRSNWKQIFKMAGIENYRLQSRWAFRWLCLIPVQKNKSS